MGQEQESAAAEIERLTRLLVDQLERLARLKEQGVLTEEEFAAQKQKILGA